jgi:ATP:cob(I)alamin adenosyltransferase|tara:strand:+ start:63 stop:572 length:510 start_codon:yes stop_codon:yes gene_type:complete
MKIYTKVGDEGETVTYGDLKVPKDSYVIDLNGYIDALQSSLDFCYIHNKEFKEIIEKINKKLWQLGGEISLGGVGKKVKDPITNEDILEIELYMDEFSFPRNFIRFTKFGSAHLNEARVRCRILERELTQVLRAGLIREEVYKYINRLSDLLFVMSYKVEVDNVKLNKK